jgi:hypothetical protein
LEHLARLLHTRHRDVASLGSEHYMSLLTRTDASEESSSRTPEHTNTFRSRPVRNIAIAAVSAIVLMMGVLFVAFPAQASVTFKMAQSSSGSSASVVFGKVTNSAGTSAAARVQLFKKSHGKFHKIRNVQTSKSGTYRFNIAKPKHVKYKLRVIGYRNGDRFVGDRTFTMKKGTAFKVSPRLTKSGGFFFLPVSTY